MKCMYCGCTDTQACPGGCWWAEPEICSTCSARLPDVEHGQLWRDVDGHARVQGVVQVEGVPYAVMLRTRGSGGRKRRPFLFPVPSLFAGDDGWRHVREAQRA